DGSLLTAKPRSCCNQTASLRPRRSARSGALPTRSRFLKYPEESGLARLGSCITHGGASKVGKRMEAAWTSSHAMNVSAVRKEVYPFWWPRRPWQAHHVQRPVQKQERPV